MRNRAVIFLATLLTLSFPTISAWAEPGFLFMASTIGPIDAGIVADLEDAFEKETGVRVRHVGAGTGAAIKIGEKGTVDLVMVHAKTLEEKFVAAGFGTERIALMYNDFVLLGPAADPAGIKGMKHAAHAMKQIAAKSALFITRGDNSGTHTAEMLLWKSAGTTPSGSWYKVYEKGSQGNAPTLKFTDEQNGYTVMDRATYVSLKNTIKLQVMVEGDEVLLNHISVIPINPKMFQKTNYSDAMSFVAWLTDPEKGQKLISDFGKKKYGSQLFFPDSKQWHEKQKK